MVDNIGRMDQRVHFQRATRADNGLAGFTVTWGDAPEPCRVWARVQAKGGREAIQSDQMAATQLFLFTVRNRTDLREDDRIVWAGDNYNIRRIERMGGRAMYLTIEAERGVAD